MTALLVAPGVMWPRRVDLPGGTQCYRMPIVSRVIASLDVPLEPLSRSAGLSTVLFRRSGLLAWDCRSIAPAGLIGSWRGSVSGPEWEEVWTPDGALVDVTGLGVVLREIPSLAVDVTVAQSSGVHPIHFGMLELARMAAQNALVLVGQPWCQPRQQEWRDGCEVYVVRHRAGVRMR